MSQGTVSGMWGHARICGHVTLGAGVNSPASGRLWLCEPWYSDLDESPVRLWICGSKCRVYEGVNLEPLFVCLQVKVLGSDDTQETVDM